VIRIPAYRSSCPGFDFRRYQIFWEVVGLERGPLSLVRIIEELLKKVAAPVYKTEINGRMDSLRWPRDILYPLKLALTSPTSGSRSVGIVRWRIKATEVSLWIICMSFYLFEYLPHKKSSSSSPSISSAKVELVMPFRSQTWSHLTVFFLAFMGHVLLWLII
jgi:hypothetical protein